MAADSIADFGASFKGFMEQMAKQAPREEPFFLKRLKEHFGAEPSKLTLVQQFFDANEHANLQLALDQWLATAKEKTLLGVAVPYGDVNFSGLTNAERGIMGGSSLGEGPVHY